MLVVEEAAPAPGLYLGLCRHGLLCTLGLSVRILQIHDGEGLGRHVFLVAASHPLLFLSLSLCCVT